MDVFLLWHVHQLTEGHADEKLIGVYASDSEAEMAKLRLLQQPGFRIHPEGFQIERYSLGQDHWTEGFVTISSEERLPRIGAQH